jgi:hypothetical protein
MPLYSADFLLFFSDDPSEIQGSLAPSSEVRKEILTMNDSSKSKEQLVKELTELRKELVAFNSVEAAQMEFS